MHPTPNQRAFYPHSPRRAGDAGRYAASFRRVEALKRVLAILFIPAALICATVLLCSASIKAQSIEKKSVLDNCARLFGTPLDAKQNLFEVNSLFVLQAKFDSHDALTELAVFPKYFLEESHPEWTEPNNKVFLSRSEFESLLSRLDEIKPKGRLVHSVENGAITNSTERYLDQYEHGFLNWFEWWDWYRSDNYRREVRFFYLRLFHPIEGKVTKKRKLRYCLGGQCPAYLYVVVGKCGYLVPKATYSGLRVGRRAEFLAAGPFNGFFGVGDECSP